MFPDEIGHGWAAEILAKHMDTGSVHHAYLFHGASGIGKLALARRFAQSLLCESEAFPPCLDCGGCDRVASLKHPDYEELRSEDVGESLQIDQVREMQRRISLAPYEANRRVVLLDRAHELTHQAANAMLKTLEEPPEHVVLLVTTQSIEALPATLVSRCEVLNLRAVATSDIVTALETEYGAETARLAGSLAGGRPGRALALAQDPEELERRRQALDDLDRLLQGDRIERFAFVDKWVIVPKDRDLAWLRRKTQRMLRDWLSLMRDVMLAANGADVELSNPDQAQRVAALRRSISGRRSARVARAMATCMDDIRANANVQLAFEELMLNLPRVPAA
jgi:DNA polymerase-3 subunit delta'